MVTKLIYPVKLKLFAVNTACVIAFSSLPSVAQLADDSSDLETWLTKEQIQAFGLNALSVDQKQALSDWIGDKLAGATQQQESADRWDRAFRKRRRPDAEATFRWTPRCASNLRSCVHAWLRSRICQHPVRAATSVAYSQPVTAHG